MARSKGAFGYGERLFQAYKAGQLSQAEIMADIASRPNAVETARRTVIEIDECREREFAAAKEKAGDDERLLAKLKGPTYQWHVRAKTVLQVIAARKWSKVKDAGTYAAMYTAAAAIVRPKRRRKGHQAIGARKIATVQRVIGQANKDQAIALLVALTDRLTALKVDYADMLVKDTRKVAHLPRRPRGSRPTMPLVPLYQAAQAEELRKAA